MFLIKPKIVSSDCIQIKFMYRLWVTVVTKWFRSFRPEQSMWTLKEVNCMMGRRSAKWRWRCRRSSTSSSSTGGAEEDTRPGPEEEEAVSESLQSS